MAIGNPGYFECDKCIAVSGRYVVDDAPEDDIGEAQDTVQDTVEFLRILNLGLENLWSLLWWNFRCDRKSCRKREACNDEPTDLVWGITDIIITDPKAPRGDRVVWAYYVEAQREIRCISGDPADEQYIPFTPYVTRPAVNLVLDPQIRYRLYYTWGTKADSAEKEVSAGCDKCTAISMQREWPMMPPEETELDAQQTWEQLQVQIVNQTLRGMWTDMWKNFRCDKLECRKKDACGDQPTYLQVGVSLKIIPNPNEPGLKKAVWYFVVYAEREIRCLSDESQPGGEKPFREYETLPEKTVLL